MAGLTDEQMAALEASQAPKGLTDEQMAALEQQHQPAANPSVKYASPGEAPSNSWFDNAKARLSDPNQWKSLLKETTGLGSGSPADRNKQPGYIEPVEGSPSFAVPGGAVPQAMKLAMFLNQTGPRRIATSTGLGAVRGAVNNPEDRFGGALSGAGKGFIAGVGGEALSGIINAGGQAIRTIRSALDPSATQQAAQEAIDSTSAALKSSQAQNIKSELGNHTIDVNPLELRGLHPEIDNDLNTLTLQQQQHTYPDPSAPLKVPAAQYNDWRVKLDQASRTASGAGITDPRLAGTANQMRETVHGLSPELDEGFNTWADNLEQAKKMDRTNSPIAFLAGKGGDRQALIQNAGSATNSNLPDVAKQLRLAKPLMENPMSMAGIASLPKSAAYGAYRSLFGNPEASSVDPRAVQGLSELLQDKIKK